MPEEDIMVIALGGNAILQPGQTGTVVEQLANIKSSCQPLIELIKKGSKMVLTHGNGPQVGNVLLRSEAAKDIAPIEPLDMCVAGTQGSMGYLIAQTLGNMMVENGLARKIAAIFTQTIVDLSDPAFKNPSKPIGPFYSKQRADEIAAAEEVTMNEDSGRGYRRFVPSPQPVSIPEKELIKDLIKAGYVVLASGGGGVPVIERGNQFTGVQAVIDKDRTSALLALEIGASQLLILTGVDYVKLQFGQANERTVKHLSVDQAERYLAAGEFPAGSMGPKIEAAIMFIKQGGKEAIITSPENACRALTGFVGTRITQECYPNAL